MERHARSVSEAAVPSETSSISAQQMAGYGVAAVAAVLVLYPVFFLFQAALDVGDPQVRPPTAYGFDNFNGIFQYPQILLNTLTVSVAATVMALVFGFVMAWILTRTNVPGRHLFEQLMAVPYYLTPLLGALAGACSARQKAALSTISGARSAETAISSISILRTASPGSWRCSRA